MKTLTALLKDVKSEFEEIGLETPIQDARLLLQHAAGISYEELLMTSKRLATESEIKTLNELARRRKAREPVSRIIGRRGFWKSEFKISPETLDPRPDSESLIEAAIQIVQPTPKTLLDLGTGSGCLLLSLLLECPKARGIGIDLSQGAIDTAKENAARMGLSERVEFLATDWNGFLPDRKFDVVLSNPPYIPDGDIDDLEPEVALFDPRLALAGGEDGLECYRHLAKILPGLVKPEGWIFLEIGHTQAKDVKDVLAASGITVLHIIPDLSGNDRVIAARLEKTS